MGKLGIGAVMIALSLEMPAFSTKKMKIGSTISFLRVIYSLTSEIFDQCFARSGKFSSAEEGPLHSPPKSRTNLWTDQRRRTRAQGLYCRVVPDLRTNAGISDRWLLSLGLGLLFLQSQLS